MAAGVDKVEQGEIPGVGRIQGVERSHVVGPARRVGRSLDEKASTATLRAVGRDHRCCEIEARIQF